MAIALVSIGRAFGVGASSTAWLVSAAYIASAVGQPTMGRLVDSFGARRMYLYGLGLVAAGALLGSLSSEFWHLILARVVLGFGTSAAYPAALAQVRNHAEKSGRPVPGYVLGALSIASQVSMGLGPLIGGLALGEWGWRGIFLINFPLVGLAAVFAHRWLPDDPPRAGANTWRSFDAVGAGLFVVALTVLLLVLLTDPSPGLIVLGLSAASAFAAWELRTAEPFIDLRLLAAHPALCVTYLRNGAGFLVLYAFTYGWTQWLEAVGYSPAAAGALLAPTFLVAAATSAVLSRRRLVFFPLTLGAAALVALSTGLLLIGRHTPGWTFLILSGLAGIATGALAVGNQAALYGQSPPQSIGVAAGLLRTAMNLGAIIAASLIGSVYGAAATDGGLHTLSLILIGISLALAAITIGDRSLRKAGGP